MFDFYHSDAGHEICASQPVLTQHVSEIKKLLSILNVGVELYAVNKFFKWVFLAWGYSEHSERCLKLYHFIPHKNIWREEIFFSEDIDVWIGVTPFARLDDLHEPMAPVQLTLF